MGTDSASSSTQTVSTADYTHTLGRATPSSRLRSDVVAIDTRTARDYDTSDITPEWHGWLHRIYQETPIEVTGTHDHRQSPSAVEVDLSHLFLPSLLPFSKRLPVRHEWLQPKPRNRLSKLGFFPTDIAPPGYLPRIIHEEPALPLSEREKRRVWAEEAEKLLARLQQERLRGIEPAPVDLALLAGHTGEWWIRRHRYAGVDELYRPWRREARPLPWLVPVNVRRKPAVDSEWESWRWSGLSWAQFFRMRDKSVEQKLVELKQARDKPKSGAQ